MEKHYRTLPLNIRIIDGTKYHREKKMVGVRKYHREKKMVGERERCFSHSFFFFFLLIINA